MAKDKEKQKEYNKKYYQENLEKERLRCKKYYEENKEKERLRKKNYKEKNPEKVHMTSMITLWKIRGVKDNDYEILYYIYMSTEFCWHCGCKLTTGKPMTSTTKCLDHCHITGLFRAILCCGCNSKLPKQIIININIDETI